MIEALARGNDTPRLGFNAIAFDQVIAFHQISMEQERD